MPTSIIGSRVFQIKFDYQTALDPATSRTALAPVIDLLYLLAGGLPVEDVWAEVAQYAPSGYAPVEPVDTANLVKALESTPGRVVFVKGNEDLDKILEHPFAAWRIFLHPAQRKIAYAPRYAGPAQVTGGAGTGKTVTALHRAAYLARQATEQLSVPESAGSVLLTAFTRNLADALLAQFELLVDDEDTRSQVEIRNVDSLAHRIVGQARGTKPAITSARRHQRTRAQQAPDGQLLPDPWGSPRFCGRSKRLTVNNRTTREILAVAVIGVAEGTVPSPSALTDIGDNPIAHAQDLQRERCLLFVALTRARDHLYISYSESPSSSSVTRSKSINSNTPVRCPYRR